MNDDINENIDTVSPADENPAASETAPAIVLTSPAPEFSFVGVWKTALLGDIPSLIQTALASALWLATAWIPYINIWTTLSLAEAPLEIAKGNKISPIEIFSPRRKERALDLLLLVGILFAVCFMFSATFSAIVIPLARTWVNSSVKAMYANAMPVGGTVRNPSQFWMYIKTLWVLVIVAVPLLLALASWSLSAFLVLERGMKPLAAMEKSRELTRGKVQTLTLILASLATAFAVVVFALARIKYVGWILTIVAIIALAAVKLRLLAVIWQSLADDETNE